MEQGAESTTLPNPRPWQRAPVLVPDIAAGSVGSLAFPLAAPPVCVGLLVLYLHPSYAPYPGAAQIKTGRTTTGSVSEAVG